MWAFVSRCLKTRTIFNLLVKREKNNNTRHNKLLLKVAAFLDNGCRTYSATWRSFELCDTALGCTGPSDMVAFITPYTGVMSVMAPLWLRLQPGTKGRER